MKLQQELPDAIHGQLIELVAIGGLILFGVVMVFLGWLKYRDRNKPVRTNHQPRPKRRAKRK